MQTTREIPFFVVAADDHDLADIEAAMDQPRPVFVPSAGELREAVAAGFHRFLDHRNRVIHGHPPADPA